MSEAPDDDAERDGARYLVLFLLSWVPAVFFTTTLGQAFAATVAPAMILIAWEMRWEKKRRPFQISYVLFGVAAILLLALYGPQTEDYRGQTSGSFLVLFGAAVYLAVKFVIKPKDRSDGHANQ